MLSSVLNSSKAIQTNIAIIKAFIALRRHALTYADLAQKIAELEGKFDREFADINEVLKWLGEENQTRHDEIAALHTKVELPDYEPQRPRIGFKNNVEIKKAA